MQWDRLALEVVGAPFLLAVVAGKAHCLLVGITSGQSMIDLIQDIIACIVLLPIFTMKMQHGGKYPH
jgi:hypothetical protein